MPEIMLPTHRLLCCSYLGAVSSGNASDLCSGAAVFASQPGHRISWVFHGFPQTLQENAWIISWIRRLLIPSTSCLGQIVLTAMKNKENMTQYSLVNEDRLFGGTYCLCWLPSWGWRQYVPPKREYPPTKLYGVSPLYYVLRISSITP
jgi:hypothetical protein